MSLSPSKTLATASRLMIAVGLLAGVAAGQARGQATAPISLEAEVQALLREGVAVGLVLGAEDRFEMMAPPERAGSSGAKRGASSAEPKPERDELVGGFARRWSELFSVADSGDVVSVTSPRARPCHAGLDRKIKGATFDGPAYRVFFEIGTTFDDSLKDLPPRGLALAVPPGRRTWENLTREVLFETSDGTLRQTLNRFTWAARGFGWYAQDACPGAGEAPCRCEVGFMTEDSIGAPDWDACAGLQCGR